MSSLFEQTAAALADGNGAAAEATATAHRQALLDAVRDRSGWAWDRHTSAAFHPATGLRVSVAEVLLGDALTLPYQVSAGVAEVLTFAHPVDAVLHVERADAADRRYTLDEARGELRRRDCRDRRHHDIDVRAVPDGTPAALVCTHCEQVWPVIAQRPGDPVAVDPVGDLIEALRLTAEYVGADLLPAHEGWAWYDVLQRHAPDLAAKFAADTERRGALPYVPAAALVRLIDDDKWEALDPQHVGGEEAARVARVAAAALRAVIEKHAGLYPGMSTTENGQAGTLAVCNGCYGDGLMFIPAGATPTAYGSLAHELRRTVEFILGRADGAGTAGVQVTRMVRMVRDRYAGPLNLTHPGRPHITVDPAKVADLSPGQRLFVTTLLEETERMFHAYEHGDRDDFLALGRRVADLVERIDLNEQDHPHDCVDCIREVHHQVYAAPADVEAERERLADLMARAVEERSPAARVAIIHPDWSAGQVSDEVRRIEGQSGEQALVGAEQTAAAVRGAPVIVTPTGPVPISPGPTTVTMRPVVDGPATLTTSGPGPLADTMVQPRVEQA